MMIGMALAFDSRTAEFVEHLGFYLGTLTMATGYAGVVGLLFWHADELG